MRLWRLQRNRLPTVVERIPLDGYYRIMALAITVGVAVVFLLNIFTPLDLVGVEIAKLAPKQINHMGMAAYYGQFIFRLLVIGLLTYAPLMIAMRMMLKPISDCNTALRSGKKIPPDLNDRARRRLLNLHFISVPINLGMWILIPALLFSVGFLMGKIGFHTAISFSARASMVGMIVSAVASLRIESYSRRHLIPLFFPEGRLIDQKGVARISISKRIRLVYRLGCVIPMIILIITLLLLQWEVDSSTISAKDYGRGILIFVLVLFISSFMASGTLNRILTSNITGPIAEIIQTLRNIRNGDFKKKVRVYSNDEIGYTGDVINEMTNGLMERDKMRQSLQLAKEVQQNLLPKKNPKVEGLDIAGKSIYCDETGGDYYDFFWPDKNETGKIAVLVGDVSGHGIPSALLMATSRAQIRQRAMMPGSISQVITDVNRQLAIDVEDTGQFMTLFYLIIDTKRNALKWVRAGHDPGIFYDPESDMFAELKGRGIALGVEEDWNYEEKEKLKLKAGQIIMLGTDGIWEAQNSQGQMFGKGSIYQIIQQFSKADAVQILNRIIDRLKEFQKGHKSEDDITLIVIKVKDMQ